MFEITEHPTKEISTRTFGNYKGVLNKIATNLGYTTPEDLIDYSEDILDFMRETTKSVVARKVFLSAIFYILNRPEYKKSDMLPYYKAFSACKIKEIKQNSNLDPVEKKEKLKQVKNNHKRVTKSTRIEEF